MIETEASIKSELYEDRFDKNHKKNLESRFAGNKLLLLGFCLALDYTPKIP